MAETFNKKEREKKKKQIRQEKQQRSQERKQQSRDGNNLDEMMAYLDINGNLTNLPPEKQELLAQGRRDTTNGDQQGSNFRTGTVKFVNYKKGFGFIRDSMTQESVFVHVNVLPGQVRENSQVKFKTRNDSRGITAILVELVA